MALICGHRTDPNVPVSHVGHEICSADAALEIVPLSEHLFICQFHLDLHAFVAAKVARMGCGKDCTHGLRQRLHLNTSEGKLCIFQE